MIITSSQTGTGIDELKRRIAEACLYVSAPYQQEPLPIKINYQPGAPSKRGSL